MLHFTPIHRIGALALLALLLSLAGSVGTTQAASPRHGYIVVFRDSVGNPGARTDQLERDHAFASDLRYAHALKGFAAQLSSAQLARLAADPDVAFVSPDATVQAVGTVPAISGDTVPTGVRRIDAGSATSVHQASNANVAVIDTGIDLKNADLNAVSGKNCVSKRSIAAQDDNGHGTHVSGTIAAKNNGSGVEGVAPGTKLYAVKVLNSQGSGTWSQVICGIDWVTANAASLNIKVASMSLGGSGSNDNNCGNTNGDALHKAICKSAAAGVTYVVAAGNSAANFAGSIPAAYPETLAVTAMSDSDGLAGGAGGAPTCRTGETDDAAATFSNYAVAATEISHTVAGPGVCITSTWKGGGLSTISGTSMATPHVSGTVALCIGNGGAAGPCSGLTPTQIIQKIRADAAAHATASNGFAGDPLHPVTGKHFGYLAWAGGY
jgi:subtilisin family serine protease